MLVVDVVIVVILVVALIAGLQRGLLASLGTILGLVAGGVAAFWLLPLRRARGCRCRCWRGAAVVAARGGAARPRAPSSARPSARRSQRRRPHAAQGVRALPRRYRERRRRGARDRPRRAVDRDLRRAGGLDRDRLLARAAGHRRAHPRAGGRHDRRAARDRDGRRPPAARRAAADRAACAAAPPVALDDPELQQAAASVARISGIAYACGTGATGSGFVIAPDRLITNAHVVAGVDTPVVELPGQRRARGQGRLLRSDRRPRRRRGRRPRRHAAAARRRCSQPGSAAAVQGYPNGGPFTSVPATVLSVGTVPVPDVYDESAAPREIYALRGGRAARQLRRPAPHRRRTRSPVWCSPAGSTPTRAATR